MWLLGSFFVVTSVLLWVSVFGYLLLLVGVARRRSAAPETPVALPPLTVILPTRNEEALIAAKLDDVARTDYPERLHLVVVDGGSRDRTVEIVRANLPPGGELIEVADSSAKSDQIDAALLRAATDVVVMTDADARLAPDCVRRLVAALMAEPRLGAVAAAVEPSTDLLEERLHWRMQNLFWWAEGQAFDAAMGSGVALAFRRSAVPRLPRGLAGDDVYIMEHAAAFGGARLCREARAEELRVPRSFAEFIEFRNRRGAGYWQALERLAPKAYAPRGAGAVWALRRWHFRVFPALVGATLASGAATLCTRWWPAVAAAALCFAVSAMWLARRAGGDAEPAGLAVVPPVLRALVFSCSALLRRSPRSLPVR